MLFHFKYTNKEVTNSEVGQRRKIGYTFRIEFPIFSVECLRKLSYLRLSSLRIVSQEPQRKPGRVCIK
jgi:hypothetical protein